MPDHSLTDAESLELDRATDLQIIRRNAEAPARTVDRFNWPAEEERGWSECRRAGGRHINHLGDPGTGTVPGPDSIGELLSSHY